MGFASQAKQLMEHLGWKPHPHKMCFIKHDGQNYLLLAASDVGNPHATPRILTPEEVESWKALENSQATPKSST